MSKPNKFNVGDMVIFNNRKYTVLDIDPEKKLYKLDQYFYVDFDTIHKAMDNQKGWISANTPPEIPDMYLVCVSNTICFQHEKEVVKVMSYHPMTGWGGLNSFANVAYWRPISDLPDEVMEYFK